jgi:protein SCO1/2
MKRHALPTWVLLACASAACHIDAAPLALPAAPSAALSQQVGASLPLDVALTASDGTPRTLRQAIGSGRAVVLVPGYYTCAQLCGLVMQGVLEALADTGLTPSAYRIVGFSIDPDDTPATARARTAAYRDYAALVASRHDTATAAIEVDLYTADQGGSERLTQALGYAVRPGAQTDDRSSDKLAHSAAFVVSTPDGRIARYFPGVRFDSRELRDAIVQASDGRVGTPTERFALLCGHFDPVTGRYSVAVLTWLRVLGVGGAALLALWIWRRRRLPTQAAP